MTERDWGKPRPPVTRQDTGATGLRVVTTGVDGQGRTPTRSFAPRATDEAGGLGLVDSSSTV